jgi:membrane protein
MKMSFSFKTFFLKLYEKAFDEDIFSSAAQVAFYFSFSIFPLLLFLVSLFGFFLDSADNFRGELFFYLKQIMPFSAYELVRKTIEEVTANSSGGKLTIGLAIALWSASAGVDSLRIALNSVNKYKEQRAWWFTKLLSISLTFVLTLLVMFALAIVFYGWQFVSFLISLAGLPIPSPFFLVLLQWVITLLVLFFIFEIFFNILPDRRPKKWDWITPGAIVSIVLWLLVSNGFRLYLGYFNTYNKFYGSIGAVIILMLWLYLTALVILIGGTINSVIKELKETEVIDVENESEETAEKVPKIN